MASRAVPRLDNLLGGDAQSCDRFDDKPVHEQIRNEIIHCRQHGQSQREIPKRLHVSRNTVKTVLDRLQEARERQTVRVDIVTLRKKRASVLDQYEAKLKELLLRYPHIQVVEILRRLRAIGYEARYTVLRQRVNERGRCPAPATTPHIRSSPRRAPVSDPVAESFLARVAWSGFWPICCQSGSLHGRGLSQGIHFGFLLWRI